MVLLSIISLLYVVCERAGSRGGTPALVPPVAEHYTRDIVSFNEKAAMWTRRYAMQKDDEDYLGAV